MGISYPYMALLSIIFFAIAVTGISFAYLYIIDQANRTPMLGVYAETDTQNNKMFIIITTRHMRGEIVQIMSVHIYGENKLYILVKDNVCLSPEDPSIDCYLIGYSNSRLLQGSTGKILIILPIKNNYFNEGKIYRGVVIFDQGIYPVAFTPRTNTSTLITYT